jgi:hypothetical protein
MGSRRRVYQEATEFRFVFLLRTSYTSRLSSVLVRNIKCSEVKHAENTTAADATKGLDIANLARLVSIV